MTLLPLQVVMNGYNLAWVSCCSVLKSGLVPATALYHACASETQRGETARGESGRTYKTLWVHPVKGGQQEGGA